MLSSESHFGNQALTQDYARTEALQIDRKKISFWRIAARSVWHVYGTGVIELKSAAILIGRANRKGCSLCYTNEVDDLPHWE